MLTRPSQSKAKHSNAEITMPFEMESMAAAIGVSVPVLRFLLCFVVTIPVSFIHRFVPSSFGKHLYAAISGAFLSYLSFGFSSNLHFLVPMLLGYLSMVLFRPCCGILTFLFGFGYLIGWYVFLILFIFEKESSLFIFIFMNQLFLD